MKQINCQAVDWSYQWSGPGLVVLPVIHKKWSYPLTDASSTLGLVSRAGPALYLHAPT